MPKTITADRLPDLLRPGMTVFVQGASGEPTPLLEALAAAPAASAGVHYVGCLIPGLNVIDPASFHPAARLTSFFVAGPIARSHAAGRVRFLPLHYSGIWQYLSALPIDLALIQVTPPDDRGQCSLGVSVHFVPAVLARAQLVVAEVNASMPRPRSSYEIPYERLDYVIETGRPLLALPGASGSDEVRRIGANVASLDRGRRCHPDRHRQGARSRAERAARSPQARPAQRPGRRPGGRPARRRGDATHGLHRRDRDREGLRLGRRLPRSRPSRRSATPTIWP